MIGGTPRDQLLTALETGGFKLGHRIEEVMKHDDFTTLPRPQKVRTGRVLLKDCGIREWVSWFQVLKALAAKGATKLPVETPVHMRLQLRDQKPGDLFFVLTDYILLPQGNGRIFRVEHREYNILPPKDPKGMTLHHDLKNNLSGLWLDTHGADAVYGPELEIVCGLP